MIAGELIKLNIAMDKKDTALVNSIAEKTGETVEQVVKRAIQNFLSKGVRTKRENKKPSNG